jgi:hypothetical protein
VLIAVTEVDSWRADAREWGGGKGGRERVLSRETHTASMTKRGGGGGERERERERGEEFERFLFRCTECVRLSCIECVLLRA